MTAPSPTPSLRLLAGTPPGGGQDRAARALADALDEATKRRPVVENLPGRGGGRSWEEVARGSGPDLLAVSSPTFVTNAIHNSTEPRIDDTTHLALLCTEHLAFAVSAHGPIADAKDLLTALRKRTGTTPIAIATALGNVNHAAASIVTQAAGGEPSDLSVDAHPSARLAVEQVVAGKATVAVVSAASALPELANGSIQVIALSATQQPHGPFKDTPRWIDFDVDCTLGTWRGVVAPPGLSQDDINRWDRDLDAAVQSSTWRTALDRHAWVPTHLSSGDATRFVAGEHTRLRAALKDVEL